MKITAKMIVSKEVGDQASDLRYCAIEKRMTSHVPQDVMVLSAGGARTMRLWVCEGHLLPDTVTDEPDEEVEYTGRNR